MRRWERRRQKPDVLSHHDLALIASDVYRGPWSDVVALDVRCSLLPRDGELVVAIPGTDPWNALDLIRDARAFPSWLPKVGLVHAGFGTGAQAMWERIDPFMRRHDLITYVGHSLGAAVGELLAAKHSALRPDQPFRFVGFGTPRVAWLNPYVRLLLARGVEAVEYRNAGDPVVSEPPRCLGYLHGTRREMLGAVLPGLLANHAMALYAANVST